MKNLFKGLFPTFLLSILTMDSFSQLGGPKWSENGNAVTSSSFLGTTNNESLFFRTNNSMRFYISATGDVVLPLLSSSSNGFAVLDNSGKIIKINFSGNASDVFFGNGTFGNLSAATGWTTTAGKTITNNKVGIGVTAPLQAFEVNGNSIFNGTVSAQEFLVGDVTSSGQNLRISTSICLDGYNPSIGMRNELCVFTQPLYLNSKPGINFHTIINDANTGNVGIGTNNPSAKLHVNGNLKVDGEGFYSGKSHFSRISGMPGDSLILFGDSTIVFNHVSNRIYTGTITGPVGGPLLFIPSKGLGLGSMFATAIGNESVAIGKYAKATANNSIALGAFVSTASIPFDNAYNIVMGRGISSTQPLINPIRNSLMVGFNSDLPTLFVNESLGLGTTGQVGIGTTYIPAAYKLAVEGKIIAEEVKVLLKGFWPDYVFEPTYHLFSLEEVENYFMKHKHLNGVPTAKEIEENGISLGEMDIIEMRKIEEGYIYMTQLNKGFKELKFENELLKAKNEDLQNQINEIKAQLNKK